MTQPQLETAPGRNVSGSHRVVAGFKNPTVLTVGVSKKNMTNTNTWYMGELYVLNTIGPAGATATEHMSIKPVEVLNQKNPLLPATGGEGRYTVYAIAAALGLACAAFSIAKSKKKKAA